MVLRPGVESPWPNVWYGGELPLPYHLGGVFYIHQASMYTWYKQMDPSKTSLRLKNYSRWHESDNERGPKDYLIGRGTLCTCTAQPIKWEKDNENGWFSSNVLDGFWPESQKEAPPSDGSMKNFYNLKEWKNTIKTELKLNQASNWTKYLVVKKGIIARRSLMDSNDSHFM